MKRNQRYRLICTSTLLCISLVACLTAQAQESEDTKLVVVITDSSGARIPGASVTVTLQGCECAPCPASIRNCESECCETRTSKPYCCIVARRSSADNGEATFDVRPGIYRARVEITNFKSMEVHGIEVSGGQTKKVEVKMEVGGDLASLVKISKAPRSIAKVFTLDFGKQGANAIVTVKKASCSCSQCPAEKSCECCVVAEEKANGKGRRSFQLEPGEYDVSFKVAELTGSLSGITIAPTAKEVKLSVKLDTRSQK